ncbi:penicillin-binding protein 2 [Candidatus Daviesbacteria bacterium]|nr:penicillin-binding protein 2 [Candidatus Daviesbacteria bacterium]
MKKRSLGFGFADELAKVSSRRGHFKKLDSEEWRDRLLPNFIPADLPNSAKAPWRMALFTAIFLISFFALFLRLFHLQIVQGKTNKDLADGNRIQVRMIHAPRGVIFDRSGVILAANSPAFRLTDENSKKSKLITREEALELEVKQEPKSYNLEIDNVRTYPKDVSFAHVLGYVGEISPTQLQEEQYRGYRAGDRIGQSGIEGQYEQDLKGVDGGEIIEIDSSGRKLRTLRTNPPIPGKNIYLNLDASLQEKLYQQIQDTLKKVGSCCGAATALDPNTGEVLALISIPTFDPNIFTSLADDSAIEQVFSDASFPLLNRVTAGTYPPGSTYKILSSLAALSSKKVTANTTIVDNGVVYLGSFKYTNWYFTQYGKTEGSVNLVKAIKRSNDTYFYEIARIVGEEALMDWSKKLKLGNTLGIDLPGEVTGLVPSDGWKRQTFKEVWYPGDTLHLYIGQGFILTTPLQIAGMTSFMAADGKLFKPYLADKITIGDQTIRQFKPEVLVSNLTTDENIQLIKEGLSEVTKSGGTAWPFFTFPIPTAGKTGTAEYGDPKGRTHAWYSGYAPVNNPKIVVTVLIEGGGEGSSVAAPVVKEAFRWFFSEDKNNLIQDVYGAATDSGRTPGE